MFSISEKKQRNIIIITFLFVPLMLLLVFSYIPAVKLIQQSFTDWDGFRKNFSYIGFQNYIGMFQDNTAVKTLVNNLAYLIISFVQIAAALYFAIILDSNIHAKNFFRSVIFLPYILNGVAVAYMFNYMYNYNDGPVNVILNAIGFGKYAIHFLCGNWFTNLFLAFIGFWQFTGLCMVVFLGALQSIPKELYEATNIDGANFFQNIRYIIMPSIKMVIQINLFLSLNGSLQAFNQAYLITKGGPGDATQTFATKAYYLAFDFHNFGKASAMGVFLVVLIALIMLVQRVVITDGGDEA